MEIWNNRVLSRSYQSSGVPWLETIFLYHQIECEEHFAWLVTFSLLATPPEKRYLLYPSLEKYVASARKQWYLSYNIQLIWKYPNLWVLFLNSVGSAQCTVITKSVDLTISLNLLYELLETTCSDFVLITSRYNPLYTPLGFGIRSAFAKLPIQWVGSILLGFHHQQADNYKKSLPFAKKKTPAGWDIL